MDKITDATAECFTALLQIRDHQGPLSSPESVHHQVRAVIERTRQNLRASELPERDAADVLYALVAFADEIALSKPEPFRGYWMRYALQVAYFNENRAGEGFFRRLQAVRGDRQRIDALRVYYLCLVFGFQGQYAVHGGDLELLRLVESLRGEIERTVGKPRELSPSAEPPDEPQVRKTSRNPAPWVALTIFAGAIATFVSLKLSLGAKVSGLETQVRRIAETAAR